MGACHLGWVVALLPGMWLLNRWSRGPTWGTFAIGFGLIAIGSLGFHSVSYMSMIDWDWGAAYIPHRIGLNVLNEITVSAPASLILSLASGLAGAVGRLLG